MPTAVLLAMNKAITNLLLTGKKVDFFLSLAVSEFLKMNCENAVAMLQYGGQLTNQMEEACKNVSNHLAHTSCI